MDLFGRCCILLDEDISAWLEFLVPWYVCSPGWKLQHAIQGVEIPERGSCSGSGTCTCVVRGCHLSMGEWNHQHGWGYELKGCVAVNRGSVIDEKEGVTAKMEGVTARRVLLPKAMQV